MREGSTDSPITGAKMTATNHEAMRATAMKMSTDLEQLKARIDALEDCARNPTDPLTKRRYAQDPNACSCGTGTASLDAI